MADIKSLNTERAARDGDTSRMTPQEMLDEAHRDLHNDPKFRPNKAVLIFLTHDHDADLYEFRRYSAGMKASEIIALLETVKHRLMHRIAEDLI